MTYKTRYSICALYLAVFSALFDFFPPSGMIEYYSWHSLLRLVFGNYVIDMLELVITVYIQTIILLVPLVAIAWVVYAIHVVIFASRASSRIDWSEYRS